MYNSRVSIGSRARQTSGFKSSLGNTAPRYNSQVAIQRRKYFISSSKNSQDVPDWMSRTQTHHFRDHKRQASMYSNSNAPFKNVQQTYVYAHLKRQANPESQFDRVVKPRWRNVWQMKNHTFELEWPRPETQIRKEQQTKRAEFKARSQMSCHQTSRPNSNHNNLSQFQMSKYGYYESPLHRQKDTPIKIGHPHLLNTTYIQ